MLNSCLSESAQMLFKGFPDECDALKVLKNGALETGSSSRWTTEWEEHAKPLITEVSSFCYAVHLVHCLNHLAFRCEYCDMN